MSEDELKIGDSFTFGQLVEELDGEWLGEASSSRIIVPKKGKLFEEDGSGLVTGRVAIIRPCISRGRRIKGLPPIYTPSMLEANANVFNGWPMYLDHLAEEALATLAEALEQDGHELLAAALQESRSVKEIGGRIISAKWDPTLSLADDADNGYQRGGIVARYRPQPAVQRMLEADPEILHVSINALPSGAKIGHAPWDASRKGALIEGIRRKPMGSVDWVFRGGAGGRPLLIESHDEAFAVSLLESAYDSAQRGTEPPSEMSDTLKEKLTKAKAEDLPALLREEGFDTLAEALGKKAEPPKPAAGEGSITEERLTEILAEHEQRLTTSFEEKLEESSDTVEDRAEEIVRERETARSLSELALGWLTEAEDNGLPKAAVNELRPRYALLPSGPAEGLLVEAETEGDKVTKSAEDVLKERVQADVQRMVDLLVESGAKPRVKGLSPTKPEDDESRTRVQESALEGFMRRQGFLAEDAEPDADDEGKTKKSKTKAAA